MSRVFIALSGEWQAAQRGPDASLRAAVEQIWNTQGSRVNMAHIRQSRPDSGLGIRHVQVKVFKGFQVVPSSLASGPKPYRSGAGIP